MHIDELIVYGRGNRVRRIQFEAGRLNIITGDSRTGKSSLINIIRFCLGADSPHVPAGPIKEFAEWFGLVGHVGTTRFFIGRPVPEGDTTTVAVLLVGTGEAPSKAQLQPNTTSEGLREYLGGLVGLTENLNIPPPWQTRLPLAASFVHSLYYCFQGQGEIANPDILFHHQNRDFQPQAIRDTLPYFLGATSPDELRLRWELTAARRELRRLENQLASVEAERALGLGRAAALLSEVREVGLLSGDENPETIAEARSLLQQAIDTFPSDHAAVVTAGPEYHRLQQERQELLNEVQNVADQLAGLEDFARVDTSYADELSEERARLATIGLIPLDEAEDASCAMCGRSLISSEGTTHGEIAEALRDASRRLELAQRDRPRIERARIELLERQQAVKQAIRQNAEALSGLADTDELASAARESLNVTSYVRGRISAYLDVTTATEEPAYADLKAAVEAAQARVRDLEDRLDPDEVRSRVASALARVSRDVTALARELSLEHADSGVRVDLDRLTIVADTPQGPAYMDRGEIGSGMNWVGYHLATYLALQRFFIENSRPVPRFVVLDQPSQAFFPRDHEARDGAPELSDTDRENTRRLYRLTWDIVNALDGQLQVIALDHAEFPDEWFADAVVEVWRGGTALIPEDWLLTDG